MRTAAQIYGRAFTAYGRQLRALMLPAFVIFFVVGLPAALLATTTSGDVIDIVTAVLAGMIGLVAVILYTGYIDEVAEVDREHGGQVEIGPPLRRTVGLLGPLFWASLLYAGTLLGGLVLFVVPGIYFAARFGLVTTAVSLEQLAATKAMARSWRLTKGHVWLLIATVVMPLVFESAASEAAEHLAGELLSHNLVMRQVADALVSTVLAPLVGLAMAYTYFEIKPSD